MLKALRFVKGAVASKDFTPVLTHFEIKDGMIKGFNGALAICRPVTLDLVAQPKAVPFIKAIERCRSETTTMYMTPAGRLAIKSGKFKAFIDCSTDTYPDVQPEGEIVVVPDGFVPTLKKLQPFIADDASRPWSRGILLRGESAFATNNIILVEYWTGIKTPLEINVPFSAVKEICRIGEHPTHLQISERSCTFHYEGGGWIRTNLFNAVWPDINYLLDKPSDPKPVPKGLFEAIDDIRPFVDEFGAFRFIDGAVCTSTHDEGASVELEDCPEQGKFNADQFMKLQGIIDVIDFTQYPAGCPFFGESLRGVIIGVLD